MNPFDDEAAQFVVLTNEIGEYSLWPAFAETPDGWRVELGPVPRGEAIAHVERTWSDEVLFPA